VSAKIEYLYYDLGVANANNDISLLTHSYPAAYAQIGGTTQVVDAPTETIDVTGQSAPLERDAHAVLGVNHVWIEDAPSVKVRVDIQAKPPAPAPERKARRG